MAVEFKKATVIKNDVLASTYHDIVLQGPAGFSFEAGQFITIRVNEKLVRSYSIAGKLPNDKFGLLVDIKPGGPGSDFFSDLQVGSEIEFIGPAGVFTLKMDDGADELVFLGTGSGIAPLKSMIETALREKNIQKKMTLYFGLRHEEDVHWDDYFSTLVQQHPNFSYKLCLSRPGDSWEGSSGHITDHFIENFSGDVSGLGIYLCGSKAMIDQVKEYVGEKDAPPKGVYHEAFY